MSNPHFWLTPAEQAIMDAAIASAPLYGFIAATFAAHEHLEERLGTDLSPRDYISVSDLTDVGHEYGAVHRFNLVRLSEAQKLVLEGDGYGLEACHPDLTGEYWGNVMLDLAKMQAGEHDHLCNPRSNAMMAVSFVQHGEWGSTLASINAMKAQREAALAANLKPTIRWDEGEEEAARAAGWPGWDADVAAAFADAWDARRRG